MSANNDGIWNAALNGFAAGVYLARDARNVKLASAQVLADQAEAFAMAVDGAIAPGSPSTDQENLVLELAQSITGNKYVTGMPASAFDEIAQSIATLYQAMSELLIPITPPVVGEPTTLIFRPGGVAAGNVYTTAAAIATALNAVNGAAFVYLDPSIDPCIMPAGVIWDFQGFGSIVGSSRNSASATGDPIQIDDTAQIRNPGQITGGVTFLCDSRTMPSFQFSDWTQFPTLFFDFSFISLLSTATVAPIQVPAGGTLVMYASQAAGFFNDEAPTIPIVSLGANAILDTIFTGFTFTAFPANLVAGDDTTFWDYIGDSSAFPFPNFAGNGFLGTLSPQLITAPVFVSVSDDCSAGGTITSSFTGIAGNMGTIALINNPGAGFIYDMPNLPWLICFQNLTGQTATIEITGGTGQEAAIQPNSTGFLQWDPVGGIFLFNLYNGQTDPNQSFQAGDIATTDFTTLVVCQLGGGNQVKRLPVFGTILDFLDVATYDGTPPTLGAPPGAPPWTGGSGQVWYTVPTLGAPSGIIGLDQTGASQGILPTALYPNTARNTQYQSSVPFRLGDTLTGVSTSGTIDFNIPDAVNGQETSYVVKVSARVTATGGGGTATVGDSYFNIFAASFKSIAGVVSNVGSGVQAILPTPNADASMTDVAVTLEPNDDDNGVQLVYTNGAAIDAGTVIDYQFLIVPEIC